MKTAKDRQNGLDDFLNDATWMLRDSWENHSGLELSDHEMDALNDLLTEFFRDKC